MNTPRSCQVEINYNSIILKECAPGWDVLSIQNITGVKVKCDKKVVFMDIDNV